MDDCPSPKDYEIGRTVPESTRRKKGVLLRFLDLYSINPVRKTLCEDNTKESNSRRNSGLDLRTVGWLRLVGSGWLAQVSRLKLDTLTAHTKRAGSNSILKRGILHLFVSADAACGLVQLNEVRDGWQFDNTNEVPLCLGSGSC
jgi:hypothetical protein